MDANRENRVHSAQLNRLPELLAPAGDWDCLRAAVENGADGVYFGLSSHNARIRAKNFSLDQLPQTMEFLHLRGVKGYVTVNTLVFTSELDEVANLIEQIIRSGADAILVQDIGLCQLIREISPDFPIHASTQMTITNAIGARTAKQLGCSRVVVARECSLAEVIRIKEILGNDCPELEIFVHGALCVAYSGQCLTSESLGGRSANRGECAQACRMPYELICDGRRLEIGDQRYLLSPKDLAGFELLPEIVNSGVIQSIKIEGRLKSPEYVANITRIYRDALDSLAGKRKINKTADSPKNNDVWYRMQMAFSRGLYTGWLAGINNQQLVHARFGKKRGVFLGTVKKIHNGRVYLTLEAKLNRGDGVVFDCGRPDLDEEGGRVYEIFSCGNKNEFSKQSADPGEYVALAFGGGDINFKNIHTGDLVWKTSDPALERELRKSFLSNSPYYKRALKIKASGCAGNSMEIAAEDEIGNRVCVKSQIPLVEANEKPLDYEILKEQLGRLGGTQFYLAEFENNLIGNVILPFSEINRLRREAIAKLEQLRKQPPRWSLSTKQYHREIPRNIVSEQSPPQLITLVRNIEQFKAALNCGVKTIYCDFEDIRKYDDVVATANGVGETTRPKVFVAPPRVFKDGEEGILKKIRQCHADGYLVRNFAHLEYFAGSQCICDFSFNISNPIAAQFLINRWKPQRITISYDLNIPQIIDLLNSAPPDWFEITLHQHMPMFYMEYCLFCKFLSSGTNWRDCGRPCEKHKLKLRDRVGAEHYVLADVACRNVVYNALAQTGAESFNDLYSAGARWFRIEFVDEPANVVIKTIQKYRALFDNKISGKDLWKELKLLNQIGVTRGQLMKEDSKKDYSPLNWG
ncbi:MAG: DUF3656 domain-containing U32 family peptidase [Verrucomicrobiia bacterium]